MSEENVEAVRNWVAAINAADSDRLIELADPEVDYLPYLAALAGESGAYRGHHGLRQYVRDLAEAWSSYEVEIHDLEDLGDHVLMQGRLRGKGRSSGLDVDAEMAWLHTFRSGSGEGRYLRLRFFASRDDALEAAGLSEQAMSEENVETVRRAYERVNATLELPRELYDPDVEFDVGDVSVEFGVIRGLEPGQEALREYWQTFENFHVELSEVLHADEDRVVTSVEDGGRMKGSGARSGTASSTSRRFAMARSFAFRPTPTGTEPSKPPDCRSRRCRRRTSRSCAKSTKRFSGRWRVTTIREPCS